MSAAFNAASVTFPDIFRRYDLSPSGNMRLRT
jgi:hypothetical protein